MTSILSRPQYIDARLPVNEPKFRQVSTVSASECDIH